MATTSLRVLENMMDDYTGQLRRKNRRLRCESSRRGTIQEHPIICYCGYREDPAKKIKTRIVRKNLKKLDDKTFKNYVT